jgi:hypothetical protein
MTHSLHEQNIDKWHLNKREYSKMLFPLFSDIRHVIHLIFNEIPVPGTQKATHTTEHKWRHCIFVGPYQSPSHKGKSDNFYRKVACKKGQTYCIMSTLHGLKGRGMTTSVYDRHFPTDFRVTFRKVWRQVEFHASQNWIHTVNYVLTWKG